MLALGIRVAFLKMWRTFPFPSTSVLSNTYPSTEPASTIPFSDGFNGFPFSSVHVVDAFTFS